MSNRERYWAPILKRQRVESAMRGVKAITGYSGRASRVGDYTYHRWI